MFKTFPCYLIVIVALSFISEYVAFGNCVNKTYRLSHYGDDASAIARMVADVNSNGGGHILFPKNKVYEVEIQDDFSGGHTLFAQEASVVMGFYGCRKVIMDLNGSTIILKGNHSTKYAMILFSDCREFSVKNGVLIGDSAEHDYSAVKYGGKEEKSSHQWGYGIHVLGSVGQVSSMKISQMTGDGIYVSSHKARNVVFHAKIDIDNCEIFACRRNGVSVASNIGFRIAHSSIHHIGTHDGIIGASPQAGIDFEYEDGVGDKGPLEIVDCYISDCTEKTVSSSNTSPPISTHFVVAYSVFHGSQFQIAKVTSETGKSVRDCRFVSAPLFCGEALIEDCLFDLGATLSFVHGTTFMNSSFIGAKDIQNSSYGCCLVGNTMTPACFVNCSFSGIRGRNDESAYQGFSGYYFPLVAEFSNCFFTDCSFAIGNPDKDSNLSFSDCTLSNGCLIQNRGGNTVSFTDSKLENVSSYPNQKGRFQFTRCELIQDDNSIQYPLLYYGNHRVKNSTVVNKLQITPDMKSRGIKAARIEEIQ